MPRGKLNADQKEKQKEKRRIKRRAPYQNSEEQQVQLAPTRQVLFRTGRDVNLCPNRQVFFSSQQQDQLSSQLKQGNIDNHQKSKQATTPPEATADNVNNSNAADDPADVDTVTQDTLQITGEEFDDFGNFIQN